jgi:fatty-acyl-CoA synthase
VPVNFRMVADEVAYVLRDSGATVVLCDEDFDGVVDEARRDAPEVGAVLTLGEDHAEASAVYREQPVGDEAAAYIMYTSGTTGFPKGAVLSHRNLYLHAFNSMATLGLEGDDRVWMSAAPLFHIAGLSGMLPALIAGGTIVIPPSGSFDPAATVTTLVEEGVTSCFMVPAQWQAICAVPDLAGRDLSRLRRISWGAAPASTTLLRTMIDAFPQAEVCTAFGQTECSPVTTYLRGEDSLRKIGSIGTPMTGVEVRVVDEDMNDVPRGTVGEIVYRSAMVMTEYWNKPEATAEAFRGGWFHSGDLVREDDDGYLYVVDRVKDMIISGGENIYCAEVENVLAGHPKIAEVALVGVPDDRWGETPLAVVVGRDPGDLPTDAEIETFAREHLAAYKRPRHVRHVDALPRNPGGKVVKKTLREQFAQVAEHPG